MTIKKNPVVKGRTYYCCTGCGHVMSLWALVTQISRASEGCFGCQGHAFEEFTA